MKLKTYYSEREDSNGNLVKDLYKTYNINSITANDLYKCSYDGEIEGYDLNRILHTTEYHIMDNYFIKIDEVI